MNLEVLHTLWRNQAIANYYIGYLVIEKGSNDYDRIFIENEQDMYQAKNSDVKIIQEVYL